MSTKALSFQSLATAHLHSTHIHECDLSQCRIAKNSHDVFIRFTDTILDSLTLSEDCKKLLSLLRSYGYKAVHFSLDGPVADGVPVFTDYGL